MNINFNLNIEEANYVLGALAKMPFEQVYGLMEKLKNQAEEQIKNNQEPKLVSKELKDAS